MTWYKDEKKRLGGSWKLYIFLIIVFNTVNFVGKVTRSMSSGAPDFIHFMNKGIWGGLALLLFYINYKLFFIKEQGESVFLPVKYEVTPLTPGQIYGGKIRIMVNACVFYLIYCAAGYWLALVTGQYPVREWGRSLLEIGMSALIGAGMIAFWLLFDLLTYLRLQRER